MGAIDTQYTFTATDTITSSKMNNIIDQTTITTDAIIGTTLDVASGKLKVRSSGITSNELAIGSVTSNAILAGSVNQAATSNMLVPSGAVMAFAMNSAPNGWLAADGSLVSRTTYANLFSAVGTTHGSGDGSTTFQLPDLRGYFVRGNGTNSDGTVSGNFGEKQNDAFQGHRHNPLSGSFVVTGGSSTGLSAPNNASSVATTGNPVTDGTNGTPRTANETRPRNIAMLYCIKT